MKILVLNCGSSSLKYQVIDMETESTLASGNFERIGSSEAFLTHKVNGEKIKLEVPVKDHAEALKIVMNQLVHTEYGIIKSLDEIDSIGHRIVHGGEKFNASVLINEEVLKEIEECAAVAPLHNPAGVLGIKACQAEMPGKPNVAVFDTAFHQTLPEKRYIYPKFITDIIKFVLPRIFLFFIILLSLLLITTLLSPFLFFLIFFIIPLKISSSNLKSTEFSLLL